MASKSCCTDAAGVASYYELDPTGQQLADYYSRLIGYLLNGEMVDEHGTRHVAPSTQRRRFSESDRTAPLCSVCCSDLTHFGAQT